MRHRTPSLAPLAALAVSTAAAIGLTACGSDSSAAPSPAGTAAVTIPGAAPTSLSQDAPAATEPGGATPAPVPADGTLCATIPSLDAINAVLDEPVTTATDLPRTPGEAICDVSGDGVSNVQFSMLTPSDRATLESVVAELGYTLTELGDPALPGAVTYAGAVTVFVGDTGYTVQAITFDTITDPNSPAAAQRSAALLSAWLPNLGVTL